MTYRFHKQRLCHLSATARDRKRSCFSITPPAAADRTTGDPAAVAVKTQPRELTEAAE